MGARFESRFDGRGGFRRGRRPHGSRARVGASVFVALVCVLLTTAEGCPKAVDTVETVAAAIKGGEGAARIANAGERAAVIERIAVEIAAVYRTGERIGGIVSEFAASPEVREAFSGLLWEVGCDVVTQPFPSTREEVASWLEQKAWSFGLSFTGDIGLIGQALLDAMRPGGQAAPDATQACYQIRQSGI